MYSGDVPAILSARKTYSFSRNRIHPPLSLAILYTHCYFFPLVEHGRQQASPSPTFSTNPPPSSPTILLDNTPRQTVPPSSTTWAYHPRGRWRQKFFCFFVGRVPRATFFLFFFFFFSLSSSSTTLPFRTDSRIDKLDELKLMSWCSNLFRIILELCFFFVIKESFDI